MDQLLPRARPHPDTPGSGTEEESSSSSCCYLAFCCIALSGVLAVGALAGASLGYEVGLNISLPRVDVPFNSSLLPLVPVQTPRGEGREEHREEDAPELPGPSVEEWDQATVDREDLEWQRQQKQWKKEEELWRSQYAENKTVFYMYRAQSSMDYPAVNINTADLGGVLWYLHNEIVCITPRKYDVQRILRFKVTVKNTKALQHAVLHKFGPFVAFDAGKCTVPTCDQIWNQYGFVVGCQVLLAGAAKYSREMPCDPAHCQGGIWYSLPGPCPTLDYRSKSEACKTGSPGGECGSSDVTGEAHCTYHVEQAGWVDLDEYTFIRNYTGFIEEGRKEYDPQTDKGLRFSFWDGKNDQKKCNWRMNRLQLLFKRRFPELPATLEPPPCPG